MRLSHLDFWSSRAEGLEGWGVVGLGFIGFRV